LARPFVSVLIDTYNHEKFVEQAIVSVLEQDIPAPEREVIVVDDGSADNTPDLVRKFEPRVRLLRKPNGGQASAFNAGIPLCRGEIISFLDGDDWWAPSKLRLVTSQLEAHPDIGAVGHGFYQVRADGPASELILPGRTCRLCLTDARNAAQFSHHRCYLGASRFTVRRAILERILPIPEELVIEADEWIFTLAPALAPVVVLDQPLFYYRLHDGNLYQFSKLDEVKVRRKGAVFAALLRHLPPRLRELGVREEVIPVVTEPIWVDAERISLSLDGGKPWRTFRAERASFRYNYSGATPGYRVFHALVLGLTLVLPPRMFYRLRQWYTDKNLARLRALVGKPIMASALLEGKPEGRT